MSESPRQSPRGPGETIPAACYISGTSLMSGLGPPGDVSGTVHEGCCDQCPRPGGTRDNGTALCFGPGAQKSETGVSAGLADGRRVPASSRCRTPVPSASSHLNRVFNAPDTATRGGRSWARTWRRGSVQSATCVPEALTAAPGGIRGSLGPAGKRPRGRRVGCRAPSWTSSGFPRTAQPRGL